MSAAERLRDLPDDALVPVRWVRSLLSGGEAFDGVGTVEAASITGLDERKLRRLHRQWERTTAQGKRPPIRVSRKSNSDRSDLLFDRSDCYGYRREHGGGPRPLTVEVPKDPNDARAIARNLLRQG